MALLEKHRNTIYTEFQKLLGEEATQAMLSQFPARDVDEPVSREHLDRRIAELTTDLTTRMATIVGGAVAILSLVLALSR
jgi:hypothetical protein